VDVDASDALFVVEEVVLELPDVEEVEDEPPRKNPAVPNFRPKKLLLDRLAKASEEQQHMIHNVTTTIIRCKYHMDGGYGETFTECTKIDADEPLADW
jgi:hypothetical protein